MGLLSGSSQLTTGRLPAEEAFLHRIPYHALRPATGRNRWQRFWLVRAVFGSRAFATGCHWLRPLGSINAPFPCRTSLMRSRIRRSVLGGGLDLRVAISRVACP